MTQHPAKKPSKAAKPAGMPAQLKAGVEPLSGVSLKQVSVHRNSTRPARLNARTYAQGSDLPLASGLESHLPHEAWHVVQQTQSRVKATVQVKPNTPINDDKALESSADAMGAKALKRTVSSKTKVVRRAI